MLSMAAGNLVVEYRVPKAERAPPTLLSDTGLERSLAQDMAATLTACAFGIDDYVFVAPSGRGLGLFARSPLRPDQVAAVLGGIKIQKPEATDLVGEARRLRFLFHGAGSANLGGASLLINEAKVPADAVAQ